jgi:hypothetical protein
MQSIGEEQWCPTAGKGGQKARDPADCPCKLVQFRDPPGEHGDSAGIQQCLRIAGGQSDDVNVALADVPQPHNEVFPSLIHGGPHPGTVVGICVARAGGRREGSCLAPLKISVPSAILSETTVVLRPEVQVTGDGGL